MAAAEHASVRPTVGRESELELLEGALDAVAAEGGSVCVAVEGEPGIGKSRLLAELSNRAEERGCLPHGCGDGIRARSAVQRVGRRPRRTRQLAGAALAGRMGSRGDRRARGGLPVASMRSRTGCRFGRRRALPRSPCSPDAAGAARGRSAAGGAARRSALERRGVDRATRGDASARADAGSCSRLPCGPIRRPRVYRPRSGLRQCAGSGSVNSARRRRRSCWANSTREQRPRSTSTAAAIHSISSSSRVGAARRSRRR